MGIVDDFLLWLEAERRYSPLTVRNYRRDIDNFLEFIGRSRDSFKPNDVQRADIEEWIIHLAEERGLVMRWLFSCSIPRGFVSRSYPMQIVRI